MVRKIINGHGFYKSLEKKYKNEVEDYERKLTNAYNRKRGNTGLLDIN